jgi:DNA-binding transcriptional ArsR family regulator
MAQNKKNEFDAELLELADFAKALSHPARLAILKELALKNTCICGEIVNVIPLAQSTVSQHLKELKNAGIIGGEIDGPKSCYCINRAKLNEMSQCLMKLFNSLAENGCCQTNKRG